ncbi:diguanylate cyclase [Sphingomonas hankookensis]|uniref:GGDEF domain-containing protein n=1 Tax=Sphingomonas hankookensis TaxID=563996 RepID=UPI001F565A83|nr:GGDEF domain-containing protein [Sphingomonas hankookensis]
MDSAVYALIVNACVAGLFAVTFAIIRLSYPGQGAATCLATAYLVGAITPLSELGILLTPFTTACMILSYASLLTCIALLALGLRPLSGLPRPWRPVIALLVAGAVLRAAIWYGPRNALWYELLYQLPFVAGSAMATFFAIDAVRRRRGPLWLALAVALGLTTAHFVVKPFFAATFGSGSSAQTYAASSYALFSQATGGVLMVMTGLLILLLVVQSAMGRTIAESETDPLTRVANRRGFERRAMPMVRQAFTEREPLAAILFDLDHFKRVNDNYGHATGDAVLRAFAMLLVDRLPPSAVIARLGGEEFVALLDRTTLRGAWLAAQSVRATLPTMGSHLPPITVSAGLAALVPGDTLIDLIDRADQCAYDAKRQGRNRICPVPDPLMADQPLVRAG